MRRRIEGIRHERDVTQWALSRTGISGIPFRERVCLQVSGSLVTEALRHSKDNLLDIYSSARIIMDALKDWDILFTVISFLDVKSIVCLSMVRS